ncbi:MAG: hypothetical protein AAF999_13715 [Pseudomonadota bacterium]
MPFVTTNGEESLDALLDRSFNRLTDRQRVTARKELLRANPRLAEIERLPKGTIINVPSRAAPRAKVSNRADDPDGEALKEIDKALSAFAKEYRTGHDTLLAELDEALEIAQTKDVIGAVNTSDELQELHAKAVGRLDDQRSRQEEQRARFDIIVEMARADIKKRL